MTSAASMSSFGRGTLLLNSSCNSGARYGTPSEVRMTARSHSTLIVWSRREIQWVSDPSPMVMSRAHGPSGRRRHQTLFSCWAAASGSPPGRQLARCGDVEVPCSQKGVDRAEVSPHDADVGVVVGSPRAADMEVEGVTAADPPAEVSEREDNRSPRRDRGAPRNRARMLPSTRRYDALHGPVSERRACSAGGVGKSVVVVRPSRQAAAHGFDHVGPGTRRGLRLDVRGGVRATSS